MKTGKMMLMGIITALLLLCAGSVFAADLVPDFACPAGYVFTPEPGAVSRGYQMGYCTPTAPAVVVCSDAPTVAITGLSPEKISARNSKTVNITISGQITLPANCTMGNAGYVLVDEYGQNDGSGSISVRDGQFAAVIPIKASRKGSDKDGRLYTMTVSAEDEYGKGQSAPVSVTVAHDSRK